MFTSALVATVLAFAQTNSPTSEASTGQLDALETAYTAAKTAYEKDSSESSKAKYVSATVTYGTAVMTSPELGAREKYPKALRLYREANALDPTNKEATDGIELIEGIYRSLDRPIPE